MQIHQTFFLEWALIESGARGAFFVGCHSITNKCILDAWEYCVNKKKAYVIKNKNGRRVEQSCNTIDKDTFILGTRIDYALCSSDIVIEKMIVDDKVREFTDHSAIRLVVKIENN